MAFTARMIRDVRVAQRHAVTLDGTLRDDGQPFDVTVTDLSADGFRILAGPTLEIGCPISLGLPGLGSCAAVVVRSTATEYGCQFVRQLSPGELAASLSAVPTVPIMFPQAQSIGSLSTRQSGMELDDGPRFSVRVRLLIVLGLAVMSWGLLVAVIRIF